MLNKAVIAIALFFLGAVAGAWAEPVQPGGSDRDVERAVVASLTERFPGARVELTDEIHWSTAAPQGAIVRVRVGDENARAQVQVSVETGDEQGDHRAFGWTAFAAYLPARIANRRVFPGERLQAEAFSMREVDVAAGQEREFRGVILPPAVDISSLQARQTLLEGLPLLSSAVERVPDVRRGDSVRVQLVTNGLTLSTQATASEPAFLKGPVRVLTDKNKRELSGVLIETGVVEVRL